MSKILIRSLIVIVASIIVGGCGNDTEENRGSSIQVTDPALQYCIASQEDSFTWDSIDDINELICNFDEKNFTLIDMTEAESLERAEIKSKYISEIIPPKSLIHLTYSAPVTTFVPTADSHLEYLELDSGRPDNPIFWYNESIELSSLIGLAHLKIKNYNFQRLLDVSSNKHLTSLELYNAFIDIALFAPESLKDLSVSETKVLFYVSTSDSIEKLYVSYSEENWCDSNNYPFSALSELTIIGCSSEEFTLIGTPLLTSLSFSHGATRSLDLTYGTHLNRLILSNNQLSDLDLTPLAGEPRSYFDARGNKFTSSYLDSLRITAEEIFSEVEL